MPEIDASDYLKASDFQGDTPVVVVDAGKWVEKDYQGKRSKKLEIGVQLPNGKIKTYTINRTSQKEIGKGYGTATEGWVGKSIVVFKAQQMVEGTLRDIVYAKLPASASIQQPQQPATPNTVGVQPTQPPQGATATGA